ncbi:hypothetical protein VM1G_12068 [Cytospora mali]|uniref:Uncharacterized protein n=1 Tax=Cytospora mali TaxID=578113 RepID=A0A194VK36_CYTMA|nr:hypothetical protein VM1G_12068 [Valsa mali]
MGCTPDVGSVDTEGKLEATVVFVAALLVTRPLGPGMPDIEGLREILPEEMAGAVDAEMPDGLEETFTVPEALVLTETADDLTADGLEETFTMLEALVLTEAEDGLVLMKAEDDLTLTIVGIGRPVTITAALELLDVSARRVDVLETELRRVGVGRPVTVNTELDTSAIRVDVDELKLTSVGVGIMVKETSTLEVLDVSATVEAADVVLISVEVVITVKDSSAVVVLDVLATIDDVVVTSGTDVL